MQNKTTTSRTLSKNKINPQKKNNNRNTNTLKTKYTKPQKGNGKSDETKSDETKSDETKSNKKKNIGKKIKDTAVKISKITIPLGIGFLLFQNRKNISENLKPVQKAFKEAFDEFTKDAAIRARIRELAIKEYKKMAPDSKRYLSPADRENDPLYIQIYYDIVVKEWPRFQEEYESNLKSTN
jgi:hypothetical protein